MGDQEQQQQQQEECEQWRPNITYDTVDTKIEYEGTFYELIHPHTSQMGWEPTQTPAFWRICKNQEGYHRPSAYASPPHPQQQPQPYYEQRPFAPSPLQSQIPVNMELAKGTLPYQWVPYTGSMPLNAVGIPNLLGKTFFVARAVYQGGIHPGYADPGNHRCFTSYGGKEVICEKFEVLVCDPGRFSWLFCSNPKAINGNPIIAGNEKDGTPLYCCKCLRDSVAYFGKTSPTANCAYYGYDGKEYRVYNFEVLVFN